ncbi:MAG TPA: hypothetical protein VE863_14985 [Pyrinomonadaceae bacterium]|jgi:hypothetical protein|nr:hypothetical protein [Pyrinomonadaceae bacterium]
MSNSLLDPSAARKGAQEILSEPELFDSELGYFELGESYFLRRLKFALQLTFTGGRIVAPIIAIIVAALFGFHEGKAFATIWAGIISGLVTLATGVILIILYHYLIPAPKKLDEILRENLKAAKQQLIEERRKGARAVALVDENYRKCYEQLHKRAIIFEVSTEIWESQVCLTDSGQTEDWRDADTFILEGKFHIRYINDDIEPIRVHNLRLSIIDSQAGTEFALNKHFIHASVTPPDQQENYYFIGFMVGAKEQTGWYFHTYFVEVPVECALAVDEDYYLRITMDAGKQAPYSVDLKVPWRAARKGFTRVSIRKENQPR